VQEQEFKMEVSRHLNFILFLLASPKLKQLEVLISLIPHFCPLAKHSEGSWQPLNLVIRASL
jgi:hypothetical protein